MANQLHTRPSGLTGLLSVLQALKEPQEVLLGLLGGWQDSSQKWSSQHKEWSYFLHIFLLTAGPEIHKCW